MSKEKTTSEKFADHHAETVKASEGGDMIAQKLATEKLPVLDQIADLTARVEALEAGTKSKKK